MSSHLRAKGVYAVEILQLREICNKMKITNLALVAIRQSAWGKRNGEYMIEVWDYDDACAEPMKRPTLIGALDELGMTRLAMSCLKVLGKHSMANEIERNYYGKRTEREGLGRGTKRGFEKREQEAGEETDLATGEEG